MFSSMIYTEDTTEQVCLLQEANPNPFSWSSAVAVELVGVVGVEGRAEL